MKVRLLPAILVGVIAITFAGCAAPEGSHESPTPTAGAASAEALVQLQLDQYWERVSSEFPDADRPDPQRVRLIDQSEFAATRAACLVEQGFDASVEDGGVKVSAPESQRQALAVARYTCTAMYPIDSAYTTPLDEEQLSDLYAYYVGELSECLRAEGLEPEAPPSLQTFIESYETPAAWTPYNGVSPDVDWSAVNKQCPPAPSGLFGEGS